MPKMKKKTTLADVMASAEAYATVVGDAQWYDGWRCGQSDPAGELFSRSSLKWLRVGDYRKKLTAAVRRYRREAQ